MTLSAFWLWVVQFAIFCAGLVCGQIYTKEELRRHPVIGGLAISIGFLFWIGSADGAWTWVTKFVNEQPVTGVFLLFILFLVARQCAIGSNQKHSALLAKKVNEVKHDIKQRLLAKMDNKVKQLSTSTSPDLSNGWAIHDRMLENIRTAIAVSEAREITFGHRPARPVCDRLDCDEPLANMSGDIYREIIDKFDNPKDIAAALREAASIMEASANSIA